MCVVLYCRYFVFFCNDTATTEIYPYGHTLSLHDALPICRDPTRLGQSRRDRCVPGRCQARACLLGRGRHRPQLPCRSRREEPAAACPLSAGGWLEGRQRDPGVRADQPHQPEEAAAVRSEEHTSELQSLMRISYAVFCLKKKTTSHTTSY